MSFFPVENYTKPFWLSEEDFIGTYRSTEELPKEQDVVIVGSGYAGSSTAYYLCKENPDLKVSLLEARNICSGATARNGGHVKPFYYSRHAEVLAEYGLESAAKYVEFEYNHLGEIKRLIEEEKIECDYLLTRLCDVFPDESRIPLLEERLAKFFANPYIKQEIKDACQVIRGENLKIISHTNTKIAWTAPAASIWPWKLITGLLKSLIKSCPNFNLQANTPLTSFKKLEDGQILVSTPRGDIITSKLVFATNAYTKAVLPEFKDFIYPFKGTVTHIKPKGDSIPHLNFSSVLFNDYYNVDYLINRPDGSIVVGGGIGTFLEGKPDYSLMFDTVDDSYNLKETEKYLENYAAKNFSTWKDYDAENDWYWSGIMGYSKDEMPYVGSLKEMGHDNCYIIAGFSGHGMPRILLSGKALAKSISSGKPITDIPDCFQITKNRIEDKHHMTKEEMIEKIAYWKNNKATDVVTEKLAKLDC